VTHLFYNLTNEYHSYTSFGNAHSVISFIRVTLLYLEYYEQVLSTLQCGRTALQSIEMSNLRHCNHEYSSWSHCDLLLSVTHSSFDYYRRHVITFWPITGTAPCWWYEMLRADITALRRKYW